MKYIATPAELLELPDAALRETAGGKALGLVQLLRAEVAVPAFFVVTPAAFDGEGRLRVAARSELERALPHLGDGLFAVRSSGVLEDGARASFAGQLESKLGLHGPEAVLAGVEACARSGRSERARAYRALHGLEEAPVAVIVQRLVNASAAGVVFSATPETPEQVVISAALGLGEGVVQGSVDCDTWYVGPAGELTAQLEDKRTAIAVTAGGTHPVPVAAEARRKPALSDGTVRTLAALARRLAAHGGSAVDLEFAVEGERLWLLQLRPVTAPIPSGRRLLWDNSNIVESFSGLTTPMTYSFARRCYAIVYQLFCRVMGVREAALRRHAQVFDRMIGFLRGRVYYNLNAWYLVLTLLPGFALTRGWMEQMMGVREVASDEDALADQRSGRGRQAAGFLRMVAALGWRGLRLRSDIAAFQRRVETALEAQRAVDFARLELQALVDRYAELERRLLWEWTAPIVNDFFLMISHGAFRQLCARWVGPDAPTLCNALLAGEGVASAVPAAEVSRIAAQVAASAELRALFSGPGSDAEVLAQARRAPVFDAWATAYLERFGDRCVDELKLEVPTLRDRPEFLVTAVRAHLAAARIGGAPAGRAMRLKAEGELRTRVRGLRGLVLRRLLGATRARMADREALRLLRTRTFGLVRRLVAGAGAQLSERGVLERPEDVWYLSIEELIGFIRGTTVSWELRPLVALRRAEAAALSQREAPAERFHTLGAVPVHNLFLGARVKAPEGDGLLGTPCCPGRVEGEVRVLRDPSAGAPLSGQILAAERTDPGWVPLFTGISGLLVERGSLLSHSAVVARELGIPAIVGIRGLTSALADGARIRMDGGTGKVERL